jgi:hypothetical protein
MIKIPFEITPDTKTKTNFPICSYDFLANNILTDIDGVLGLDFIMGKKICIDLAKFEITINT